MTTPARPSFTPGPWHCNGSGYKTTGTRVYRQWGNAGNQQLIADATAHGENLPECRANARLIASAPTLYATLLAIAEGIERDLRLSVDPKHPISRDTLANRAASARAALAQAEGPSPTQPLSPLAAVALR